MKKSTSGFWLQRPIHWSLIFSLASVLISCSSSDIPIGPTSLNSRYTEEQPTLSGNGRFLAFVSNRNGSHQILVYNLERQSFIGTPGLNRNLERQSFIGTPGLNRPETIAESPSLSYTGRYIVYLTSDQGRPVVALYDRAIQQSQILTPVYRGWVRKPGISPDGRYVVFETASRGQWDIEVLDRGRQPWSVGH